MQEELKAVRDKDALAAFLKKNDAEGTIENFGKAVKAKTEAEGEITDDAAEAAAGGFNWREYIASTADDSEDEDFGKAIKAKTGAVGEINDDDVEAVAVGIQERTY